MPRDDTFDTSDEAKVDGAMEVLGGNAQGRLRGIVERVERLNEDKAAVQADIKGVMDEAKGEGFDVKIIRKVIARRKLDKVKRDEQDALTDLYEHAINGDDL